jgi:hypothetical protein
VFILVAIAPTCSRVGGQSRAWQKRRKASYASGFRVIMQPTRAPQAENRFDIESTRITRS